MDARNLFGKIGSKQTFSGWLKRKIKKYNFVKDLDFKVINQATKYNQVGKIDYICSINMSMCMAIDTKNVEGLTVYRYLAEHKGHHVVMTHPQREEVAFGENVINKLFNGYEVIPQYQVEGGVYRIDWYIPELKLAIEFDEEHHSYHRKEDIERQKNLEALLGCKFLRYKKN